jgi:hypothetical protein
MLVWMTGALEPNRDSIGGLLTSLPQRLALCPQNSLAVLHLTPRLCTSIPISQAPNPNKPNKRLKFETKTQAVKSEMDCIFKRPFRHLPDKSFYYLRNLHEVFVLAWCFQNGTGIQDGFAIAGTRLAFATIMLCVL